MPTVSGRQVMFWNRGEGTPALFTTEIFGCTLQRFCANNETSKRDHFSPARSAAYAVEAIGGTLPAIAPFAGSCYAIVSVCLAPYW